MAEERPHVIALPFPAQGHLPPILHLSRRLAARGTLVTIVNVESIHKQLLKNCTFSDEEPIRLQYLPFQVDIPFGYDASCNVQRVEFNKLMTGLATEFEQFVSNIEPRPTCILSDDHILWTKRIAKNIGVPCISYWPGNSTWSSIHHHLLMFYDHGDLPVQDQESLNKRIEYIPGLSPTKLRDTPEYFHNVDRQSAEAYYNMPGHMRHATWVIVNSFYELEPQSFDAMRLAIGSNYVPVGPLFPLNTSSEHLKTSLRTEDQKCLDWLDKQERGSVLYISFGSCSSLTLAEFDEFINGLLHSKVRFLWVFRRDLLSIENDKPYNVYEELVNEQGFIVEWAPQLKVLSHRSVGGFLTHCGWNSIFESICNGVPMLGFPRHSDQDLNCKLVSEDWKIGKRLAEDKVLKRDEVSKVIKEFMDNKKSEDMRLNSVKLRDAARKAAEVGGSSYQNIENLVEEIKGFSKEQAV